MIRLKGSILFFFAVSLLLLQGCWSEPSDRGTTSNNTPNSILPQPIESQRQHDAEDSGFSELHRSVQSINVDSGSLHSAVGSYVVELSYDPQYIQVGQVTAGDIPEFSANPLVHIDAGKGLIRIAGLNLKSLVSPRGEVEVAQVHYVSQEVDAVLQVEVVEFYDTRGVSLLQEDRASGRLYRGEIQSAESFVRGDVNGNGSLDTGDALLVTNVESGVLDSRSDAFDGLILQGYRNHSSEDRNQDGLVNGADNGDVNGDGQINSLDALSVLQCAVRLKTDCEPAVEVNNESVLNQKVSAEHDVQSLIVKFREERVSSVFNVELSPSISNLGGTVVKNFKTIPWQVVSVSATAAAEGLRYLNQDPSIEKVELNHKVNLIGAQEMGPHPLSDDLYYNELWGLENTGQVDGTVDFDIDAPEAWDLATGEGIIVAVIDTGIDLNHEDLVQNIWQNTEEVAGDGVDNDGNGYVDDVYGYDFRNDDSDPTDDHMHGTHVSGTIAAVGNNGMGVIGVSYNASIMPLKSFSSGGSGYDADNIAAIDYANVMGANVINASWGHYSSSDAMKAIVNEFGAAGGVFVAAAGNSASNNDISPMYPASYDLDNVIAVAATSRGAGISYYSNYGETSVDVGAPGSAIYSSVLDGSYGFSNGTSMASPHVAGVVALMKSLDPSMAPSDIRTTLIETAVPLGDLDGKTVSGGQVNAYDAVSTIELVKDILIDSGHENFSTVSEDELNDLVSMLKEAGHAVKIDSDWSELTEFNTLVIFLPESSYTEEEQTQIDTFVQGGGTVVLVGEHGQLIEASGVRAALNGISQSYGISFDNTVVVDEISNDGLAEWVVANDIAEVSRLTDNVTQVVNYAAGSLSFPEESTAQYLVAGSVDATVVSLNNISVLGDGMLQGAVSHDRLPAVVQNNLSLLSEEEGVSPVVAAYQMVGENGGKVVALTDASVLLNSDPDGDGLGSFEEESNQVLLRNIFSLGPPSATVPAPEMEFFMDPEESLIAEGSFTIENTGGTAITWEASTDVEWLTVPESGLIPIGTTASIPVNLDGTGLGSGAYEGTIYFNSSAHAEEQLITVILNIVSAAISVDPLEIVINTSPGFTVTENLTISNVGGGTLNFSITKREATPPEEGEEPEDGEPGEGDTPEEGEEPESHGQGLSAIGDVLEDIELSHLSFAGEGLVWANGRLWVPDYAYGKLHTFDLTTGEELHDLAITLGEGVDSITWDGTYFWYVSSYFLVKSSFEGEELARFSLPYFYNGLAWDGSYLWGLDAGSTAVLAKIDPETGDELDTIWLPGSGYDYDSLDWDGRYFWFLEESDNELIRYDPSIDENTYYDLPYNVDSRNDGVAFDGSYLWVYFSIDDRFVKLDIEHAGRWYEVAPSAGGLEPGESMSITLSLEAGLEPNVVKQGLLVIASNDFDNPEVLVNLTMNVDAGDTEAPAAPTGIEGFSSDSNALFIWDANTEEDLAGYRLYYNTEPGVGADDSYVELDPGKNAHWMYWDNDTTYYVRIQAFDDAGIVNYSELSEEVMVRPTRSTDLLYPTVVTEHSASLDGDMLTVQWNIETAQFADGVLVIAEQKDESNVVVWADYIVTTDATATFQLPELSLLTVYHVITYKEALSTKFIPDAAAKAVVDIPGEEDSGEEDSDI